jgi:hypothetical protein
MKENRAIISEILEVLKKEGLLERTILVGSWAVYFYHELFEDFDIGIRTTDIDFYVPFPKEFKEKYNIIHSLRAINYDVRMDTLTNKVVFFSPDEFALEFITGLSREEVNTIKLGNTTIYAESLPYLNLFNHQPLTYTFEGITIKLASPSAYVVQKLLILHLRKQKTTKDVEQLDYIVNYLHRHTLLRDELRTVIQGLSKKAKKIIQSNAKAFQLNLILDYLK